MIEPTVDYTEYKGEAGKTEQKCFRVLNGRSWWDTISSPDSQHSKMSKL